MSNDLKKRIGIVHKNIRKWTKTMEYLVHEFDNSMTECRCNERKVFDFRSVSTETECSIMCLNCGGYIEPKDLENCGMF